MKFTVEIPDHLVEEVSKVFKTITDGVKEASDKAQETVDSFNTEEYKRRTANLLDDIKEALENDVETVADEFKDSLRKAHTDLKSFFSDLLRTNRDRGVNPKTEREMTLEEALELFGLGNIIVVRDGEPEAPVKEEEIPEEPKPNMVDMLMVDLAQLDFSASKWLMDGIMSGAISEERYTRALNTTKTSETLYFLLHGTNTLWSPTPQGEFFWTSIYKELGGTPAC